VIDWVSVENSEYIRGFSLTLFSLMYLMSSSDESQRSKKESILRYRVKSESMYEEPKHGPWTSNYVRATSWLQSAIENDPYQHYYHSIEEDVDHDSIPDIELDLDFEEED
jgi:hypothetical protein